MSFAFRPTATIEIGGRRLTGAEAGLERLSVTLGLAAHGHARIDLWPRSKFAGTEPGAALKIALGAQENLVLTGAVSAVSRHPDRTTVDGLDATAALSRTRSSTTFLDQKVADIVRNLADRAGVAIDAVDGELKLQSYAIDNRRSLWRYLTDLALLSGVDLVAAPDGSLRFAASRGETWRLRHGADLLDWQLESDSERAPPGFGPHGAASQSGPRNWHHLLADPLGKEAPRSLVPGVARSRETADAALEAAAIRASREKARGRALTLGEPKVRPGDLVEIDGVPGVGAGDLGGALGRGGGGGARRYRAITVSHRLDPASGFTTELSLEGTGEDASLAGGFAALAGGLAG